MRWRLRFLFLGLMAVGVAWIHLLNYVRLGRTPLDYPVRVLAVMWGGALFIGLLLDLLAGLHLRPFFAALARLRGGQELQSGEAATAAIRAIRFPERAAAVLMLVSLGMIVLHRVVQYGGDLVGMLGSPEQRGLLLSSATRDLVHALLIALLLFTFSRRLLRAGVAQLGLWQVPDERQFPIGLRLALIVVAMGVFNISLFVSAPEAVPVYRLIWIYLPPVVLTGLIAYLMATDIGRDLVAIAGRLRMLAAGIRPTLFDRFAVTDRDEVGELVAAINVMQDRAERELQQLERDLAAARAIQTGMLPRDWRLPPGWQLTAHLHPAREVGGDFYDLIDLGDGRFGLGVGDAAGKGLPAALLMASAVSLLRSQAPLHERPDQVLAAVNRLMCPRLLPMAFVTLAYAVVDTRRHTVRVACAGHFPPLLGGQELPILSALPLGVDPDAEYAEQVCALQPGSSLLLYSDGLLEGVGPDGYRLHARWRQVVGGAGGRADELARRLIEPVRPRIEQGALEDDVTLLLLVAPAESQFEIPSQDGAELEAAERAARFARDYGPAERADDVASAVGEACLNAIAHGNGFAADRPVRVSLRAGPDWLEAAVTDSGPLFTPPERPPDMAQQMAGEGPFQGWGFHLIRAMADEVRIVPTESGKQVTMRFGGSAGV